MSSEADRDIIMREILEDKRNEIDSPHNPDFTPEDERLRDAIEWALKEIDTIGPRCYLCGSTYDIDKAVCTPCTDGVSEVLSEAGARE